MLETIKDIFKSNYYLLGVYTKQDIIHYQLLLVSYNDGELDIEMRYASDDLETLFKETFKKDYPVILYLEGTDILSKKTSHEAGYRSSILFKANLDEFYFYEYKQEEDVFVSAVRKDYVNQLITTLNSLNLTTIHLAFGPFVLVNLLQILKQETALSSFNYELEVSNKGIINFSKKENEASYKINEEYFSQKELPLLASFFDYKFPVESVSFENNFASKNKEDYKYKKRLKTFGTAAIVLLLMAIVISHNLLGSYLTQLGEKQSLYVFSNQKIEELNTKKAELKLKESILESSSVFNKSFVTKYYADLGNSTPKEVTLNNIDFLPFSKKIRAKEKVLLKNKTIIVDGETNNDNAFNNWVEKLQQIKWVKKIDITDYKQDKNNNAFKLNIEF